MSFDEEFPIKKFDHAPGILRESYREVWNRAQEDYKRGVKEAIEKYSTHDRECENYGPTNANSICVSCKLKKELGL